MYLIKQVPNSCYKSGLLRTQSVVFVRATRSDALMTIKTVKGKIDLCS